MCYPCRVGDSMGGCFVLLCVFDPDPRYGSFFKAWQTPPECIPSSDGKLCFEAPLKSGLYSITLTWPQGNLECHPSLTVVGNWCLPLSTSVYEVLLSLRLFFVFLARCVCVWRGNLRGMVGREFCLQLGLEPGALHVSHALPRSLSCGLSSLSGDRRSCNKISHLYLPLSSSSLLPLPPPPLQPP